LIKKKKKKIRKTLKKQLREYKWLKTVPNFILQILSSFIVNLSTLLLH